MTIYDVSTTNFIDYIKNLTSHDENAVIEKLAKIITGYYIEDWQPSDYNNYKNGLINIIKNIKSTNTVTKDKTNRILLYDGTEKLEKYVASDDEISAIGNTMKNNIEEIMNEYGDSLTQQEKISILVNIIKKYI